MNRRALLAGAPAALALAGGAAAVQAASPHPDAKLIRTCHEFAEADLTGWYRYITAEDTIEADEAAGALWVLDRDTLDWIAATPATTPEGWQAKALAFMALDRNAYDDEEDCDASSPLLASLLRDMVAPARAAIMARLIERFGPPPEGYAADGRWVGYPA